LSNQTGQPSAKRRRLKVTNPIRPSIPEIWQLRCSKKMKNN